MTLVRYTAMLMLLAACEPQLPKCVQDCNVVQSAFGIGGTDLEDEQE